MAMRLGVSDDIGKRQSPGLTMAPGLFLLILTLFLDNPRCLVIMTYRFSDVDLISHYTTGLPRIYVNVR
jgi:hypothetical protein